MFTPQRLKYLRIDVLGFTLQEFAEILSCPYEELALFENNGQNFNSNYIQSLSKIFHINEDYLNSGNNPIFQTLKSDNYTSLLNMGYSPFYIVNPDYSSPSNPGFPGDNWDEAVLVFSEKRRVNNSGKTYERIIYSTECRIDDADYYRLCEAILDFCKVRFIYPENFWLPCFSVTDKDLWQRVQNHNWYARTSNFYLNIKAQDKWHILFRGYWRDKWPEFLRAYLSS